jgi:hypothetical protein
LLKLGLGVFCGRREGTRNIVSVNSDIAEKETKVIFIKSSPFLVSRHFPVSRHSDVYGERHCYSHSRSVAVEHRDDAHLDEFQRGSVGFLDDGMIADDFSVDSVQEVGLLGLNADSPCKMFRLAETGTVEILDFEADFQTEDDSVCSANLQGHCQRPCHTVYVLEQVGSLSVS